jgi:hypothetical protein
MTTPASPDRLRLDPDIEAQIQALQSEDASARLLTSMLRPNWFALPQPTLDRLLLALPMTASRPLVPRGAGPDMARAADVGDLMRALWAVPAFQQAATRVGDQVADPARRGWERSSAGDKAVMISSSALMAGGALAGVLSNQQARTATFNLLVNRDVPVPGVDGLTVRLRPRGAAATYRNIGGSGLGISAGGQATAGRTPDCEVMFTFDVTRYVRNW